MAVSSEPLDFQSRLDRLIPDVSKKTMRNNVKMIIGQSLPHFLSYHSHDTANRNIDIYCFSDSYDLHGDLEHIHSRAHHIHEHHSDDDRLNDHLLNECEQPILLRLTKSMDDSFIIHLIHSSRNMDSLWQVPFSDTMSNKKKQVY